MAEADDNYFQKLLATMDKFDASDLHIKVGAPPVLRVQGLCRQLEAPPFTLEGVAEILESILSEEQTQQFFKSGSVDLAYAHGDGRRIRLNVYRERGSTAIAARRIRTKIPTFADLNLPSAAFDKVAAFNDGLVFVCGATGSGKSTTIASVVDLMNERSRCHIVTIEDPIEFVFKDKKSLINQREIGIDVATFHEALRSVLRQDPDVIVIGEMRDSESFDFGLQAAETGHLVLTTLHANTASQAISRILELYPDTRHQQIRMSLFFTLRAVICQKLVLGATKEAPRVPALEVMFATPIVKQLIQRGEDGKLGDAIRGAKEDGMMDFNRSLADLIKRKLITEAVGMEASPSPEALRMRLQGIVLGEERSIMGV